MSIDIQVNIATHNDKRENRVSSFWIFPDGGMRIRVKNADRITIDEYSPEDRIALARFLLSDPYDAVAAGQVADLVESDPPSDPLPWRDSGGIY